MSDPDRTRLPIAPEPLEADSHRLSRRTALQGLATSLGATLIGPSSSEAHPLAAHVAQRARQPPATSRAANAQATAPRFLDAHQLATLAIVADLIVPGARASDSHLFIDRVLAIERVPVQQQFLGALGAVDATARDRYQQAFKNLTRAQQLAVLEGAGAEPADAAGAAPTTGDAADPERAKPTGPKVAIGDPISQLKTWVAGAHYSSEPGMKELGWTGALFFSAFPACTHAEGHE